MTRTTQRLDRLARLVDRRLTTRLPRSGSAAAAVPEAMRYCVFSGGKRFRPLLCLAACEAVGAPAARALSAACAIELVHTYSLVHDDLPAMDNAATRRGKPTCHRRFGEGHAILVGDALLTLAFECLAENGTPHALPIIRTLSEASGTTGLIGGQALDLAAVTRPAMVTPRVLTQIAQRKTAALITASIVAGALAGGARPSELRRLRRYGQLVGVAFQLIDDVHDGEGLARVLGRDGARSRAHRLIERAIALLSPLGRRAELLRQIARWLASTAPIAPSVQRR